MVWAYRPNAPAMSPVVIVAASSEAASANLRLMSRPHVPHTGGGGVAGVVAEVAGLRGPGRAGRRRSGRRCGRGRRRTGRSGTRRTRRDALLGGAGCVLLDGDRHVADVPARRLGDLADGVGERHQPRAGQLVDLADVAVVGERRHRDVGDVVGVDERLELIGGGKPRPRRRGSIQRKSSLKFCMNQAQRTTVTSAPVSCTHARRARPPPRRGPTAAPAAERPAPRPARRTTRTASGAPGTARSGKYEMYAARTPCSAGAHVAWSSQSNGGSAEREPTRVGMPRAVSRSTIRRPVLPVPPRTRIGLRGLACCRSWLAPR